MHTRRGAREPNCPGARVNLGGTVVPAYFFNSLLGRVPLIGKLLSPQKGRRRIRGGLLVARPAIRPERLGQTAFGADAWVPEGIVRGSLANGHELSGPRATWHGN
jgi:hypothetical protein